MQRARRHKLTPAGVEALLLEQSGRCAICYGTLDLATANIDHDHRTGVVRGVLCGPCNRGLGHFCDDPTRLRAAVRYLEPANA